LLSTFLIQIMLGINLAKLGNVWTSGSSHFVFLEFDQGKSFGKESNKEKDVNWPGPLLSAAKLTKSDPMPPRLEPAQSHHRSGPRGPLGKATPRVPWALSDCAVGAMTPLPLSKPPPPVASDRATVFRTHVRHPPPHDTPILSSLRPRSFLLSSSRC
jgi:hypothetical protein